MESQGSILLPTAAPILWDFLRRPANLARLADPEMNATLIEAPEFLELGGIVAWKLRRFGLSQRMELEIVELEEGRGWVEEQRQGPWQSWRHERRLVEIDGGTRFEEKILYQMPRGLLGRMISAEAVAESIEKMFAFRDQALTGMFR